MANEQRQESNANNSFVTPGGGGSQDYCTQTNFNSQNAINPDGEFNEFPKHITTERVILGEIGFKGTSI